jgi:hypothetical protein
MKLPGLRRWTPGAVAFVAAAGLLAEPALADKAMFRLSFRFLGAKGTVTTGVRPTLSTAPCGPLGSMGSPLQCPPAEVGSASPAARFTIPAKAFENFETDYSYLGIRATYNYIRLSTLSSYNGRGLFQPNNPHGVTAHHRMVFPTTMGNPAPNLGTGNPVTPTTTFGGSFDERREGSAKITAGPNRFGGTIQVLFGPNARYQFRGLGGPRARRRSA